MLIETAENSSPRLSRKPCPGGAVKCLLRLSLFTVTVYKITK